MASIARMSRAARPASFRCAFSSARVSPVARIAAPRWFSTSLPTLEKKYTRDHEWIDISADRKSAVIGISEYAAEQLGDVVYVELPEAAPSGEWIEQGDAVGAVESVKSASDINAPLRLRVKSVNQHLEEKPGTINQVPEDDAPGGGWIAKVELDGESLKGLEGLMDGEAYKQFTSSEE